ncbi:MAG: UvrB/UvrC motif-containing protein [Verrucomicrobiae bacterium]|nr:UvrB/UvrC motif-containing protein [Verrucomicrobiae bacterium]MCX7722969.1 UvrB/UvrC motif-containing protein [Verrucomicrobiae bacterium]MDW7980439.1 UvrB/UvrC motif-containing protein [Verrucomicrobiales bacterium]
MKRSVDIRPLLDSWPFDPENDVRIVRGDDGREIIQVRTPVGIEQLELTGRPDGAQPYGMESALEYHMTRLEQARREGREADFELGPQECAELFAEGTLYYLRYLRLFQLQRWAEVVRDTARNIRLFDFVHRYAAREEDRNNLEKWRPYILRMNAVAAAMLELEKSAFDRALQILNTAIEEIEALPELDDDTFYFERHRSLLALRELVAQVERNRPLTELERLERQLKRAIETQQFERAAELRDRIRSLKNKAQSS